MNETTIIIPKDLRDHLMAIKYSERLGSVREVILYLIDLYEKVVEDDQ